MRAGGPPSPALAGAQPQTMSTVSGGNPLREREGKTDSVLPSQGEPPPRAAAAAAAAAVPASLHGS